MLSNFDKSWRCTTNTHSSLTLSSLTTPIFPPLDLLLQFLNPSINIILNLLLRRIMIIIIILLQVLHQPIIPINLTILIAFKAQLLYLFLMGNLMYFNHLDITWRFECRFFDFVCNCMLLWVILGLLFCGGYHGFGCGEWLDDVLVGLGLFLDLLGFVVA